MQNVSLIVDFYSTCVGFDFDLRDSMTRLWLRLAMSFNSAGCSAELGVTSLRNKWFLTVRTKNSSTSFVSLSDQARCSIWFSEVKKPRSSVSEVEQGKCSWFQCLVFGAASGFWMIEFNLSIYHHQSCCNTPHKWPASLVCEGSHGEQHHCLDCLAYVACEAIEAKLSHPNSWLAEWRIEPKPSSPVLIQAVLLLGEVIWCRYTAKGVCTRIKVYPSHDLNSQLDQPIWRVTLITIDALSTERPVFS